MTSGCANLSSCKNNVSFPDEAEILCRLKKYPNKPLYPPAADRKAWLAISETARKKIIADAEKVMKSSWITPSAKDYMLFKRAGNRSAYEMRMRVNRNRLINLVCGECCEYSGRFMDEIIEGLWQILSEPVWCYPAHERIPDGELFPDPSRFQVDLLNVATGRILCDTLALLEPELTKISPNLVKRIKMEVMRRLIEPAEKLNDENTWWFSGRNNWTSWCAAHIISCGIYLLDDQPARLAKLIDTYLGISIRFYNRYPDDGGCDEGPSYWFGAPGKYIQVLHQLDHRLALKGRLFNDKKLKKMCEYLPGMKLSGDWFLSVADAAPKPRISSSARFITFVAKTINSPRMLSLAKNQDPDAISYDNSIELDTALINFFNPVPENIPDTPAAAVDYWENMGLSIMREKPAAPEKGTVVSLKGGHNAESHNHLDLGHFTLLRRNKPLITDIGHGVYSAKTFSSERYTLWNINSEGHNAPRFNNLGQEWGGHYTAPVTMQGDSATSANLSKAYPENVGVKSFTRKVSLNRQNGNVSVCDTVQIDGKKSVRITLFSAVEPEKISADTLQWKKLGRLKLKNLQFAKVEKEELTDAAIKTHWGKLYRIELIGNIQNSGSWNMDFEFDKK